MSRFLFVATAGAGGDLQPLAAAAEAVRARGHEIMVLGDGSVERSLAPLGFTVQTIPPDLDLGPALIGAIREAMTTTDGDLAAAGPIVRERMTAWAERAAHPVGKMIGVDRPDAVVTSLFGVEVLHVVSPQCPWAVINSVPADLDGIVGSARALLRCSAAWPETSHRLSNNSSF